MLSYPARVLQTIIILQGAHPKKGPGNNRAPCRNTTSVYNGGNEPEGETAKFYVLKKKK